MNCFSRLVFQMFLLIYGYLAYCASSPMPATADISRVIKISENINSSHVQDIMRLSKAAEMRNYMNESIDPCQNFYRFACDNWAKINPANSVEHITTGFFESTTKGLDRKVTFVLNAGADPVDTETDKKVKDFYKSCIEIRNQRGAYREQLNAIIHEFGEMPALFGTTWDEEKFDWLETIANISYKYGTDIIIGIDILPDYANNSVNRVYIGHPDFPLESRSMYLDEITSIYRLSYVLKIAGELRQFLGMNEQLAMTTAREIMDFEVSLARGMIDENLGMGLDEMSVLTTIDKMQRKYAPTIDINKLVYIIQGEYVGEPVYEFVEQYQRNLVHVLRRTSKRIVANYIFYNLIEEFFLKSAKTQAKQEHNCVDRTKKYFAKNLDNMIYRKYNTKETEHDINLIWKELKKTFKSELLSNRMSWIQLVTRQYAVEKLNAMQLKVNSYEGEYAVDNFAEEFKELNISSQNYVQNIKSIRELGSRQARDELNKPPKPLEAGELLSYTPANIIIENTIKLPVSLLQPYYLWAKNYPNALKFGTLGALVGHELIHGFDDSGRKFDKDGNNNDWWDEESTKEFIKRAKCYTNQYSNYIYGGRYLPRSASQSENIADNGGLRLAYTAYLKWYEEAVASGQDLRIETLPSMNYTSKQLFFISYAQIWCSDVHPSVRDLQTSTDQHVPGKYRVIGPLSNFDEFAKEFSCAAGTTMNPRKKCEMY